jgi:tetratricopeptide (TPR) repeat protein
MIIRPLLRDLEKRVPARAAQLRLKLAEMDKALDPRAKAWAQYDSITSKTPEGILEEAAKAPAEMRGQLYIAAASKLFKAGEVEKARAIANENLHGQERDQLLAFLDNAEVARAVEKGNTDDARAVVSRIKSKERRASALAELALAYAAKGDKKTAGGLLEEARSLLDRQPDNEREVEALLEVARGYALVEPSKTFEMIDPLIDQANDMMSAAALLEKFGAGGGMFRKGEMILGPGMGELGGMYARYVKALSELARVDFDRTRATADRFNRDEARLMARLIIARSILSDHLDPANTTPGGIGVSIGGAVIDSN